MLKFFCAYTDFLTIKEQGLAMNVRSIKVKYTALFSTIGLILLVVSIADNLMVNRVKNQMLEFSNNFTPAVSAILNADRDLYQARVAELQYIAFEGQGSNAADAKKDFMENAQQAFDRMTRFQELMTNHPSVTIELGGFNSAFKAWKQQAGEVFTLVDRGDLDSAEVLSDGASEKTFSSLRDIYDIAGEAANLRVEALEQETIANVASRRTWVLLLTVFGILIAVTTSVLGPTVMSSSIRNISKRIREIAEGDGDLTQRICSNRKDEIGELSDEFDNFLNRLQTLIRDIKHQSEFLNSKMENLQDSSKKTNNINQSQAADSESVATAVNEMTVAVKDVADHATRTADEIGIVESLASESQTALEKSVGQIDHLSDNISQSVEVVERLSENSEKIVSVLDVIRGIAEQTNLLALNAAIEAARAGEQGRGFAVVADEVRTLASRTQESTESIQDMIQLLQSGVSEAVTSIRKGADVVATTVELANNANESIMRISASTSNVSNMSTQIATATDQQSHVAEEINANLTRLADSSHESQSLANGLRQLAIEVNEQVNLLHSQAEKFTTE